MILPTAIHNLPLDAKNNNGRANFIQQEMGMESLGDLVLGVWRTKAPGSWLSDQRSRCVDSAESSRTFESSCRLFESVQSKEVMWWK